MYDSYIDGDTLFRYMDLDILQSARETHPL